MALRNARQMPEYDIRNRMLQRCYNRFDSRFHRYGGRGIKVCQGWRESFENFLEDMGHRPIVEKRQTLERRDNDGGYWCGHCEECIVNGWLSNCFWTTFAEQSRNNSRTKLYTFNGKTQCLKDWAQDLKTTAPTLRGRLERGWTIARTLSTPPNSACQWPRVWQYKNE